MHVKCCPCIKGCFYNEKHSQNRKQTKPKNTQVGSSGRVSFFEVGIQCLIEYRTASRLEIKTIM